MHKTMKNYPQVAPHRRVLELKHFSNPKTSKRCSLCVRGQDAKLTRADAETREGIKLGK